MWTAKMWRPVTFFLRVAEGIGRNSFAINLLAGAVASRDASFFAFFPVT
jgi:hypothetical protein